MADPMETLIAAERIILSGEATADQVRQAVASVDALGLPEYSKAIRRTFGHEARHALDAPGSHEEGAGGPEGG